jgi:WD40 repeat protein
VSTSLDKSVRVFDVNAEKEALAVKDAHPDTVLSQTFDYQGGVVATSCKDRILRLIDPRSGKVCFIFC